MRILHGLFALALVCAMMLGFSVRAVAAPTSEPRPQLGPILCTYLPNVVPGLPPCPGVPPVLPLPGGGGAGAPKPPTR